MEIQTLLTNIHKLPEASQNKLIELIAEVKHPKGYRLLSANKIERNIYFIKKGMVRAYTVVT